MDGSASGGGLPPRLTVSTTRRHPPFVAPHSRPLMSSSLDANLPGRQELPSPGGGSGGRMASHALGSSHMAAAVAGCSGRQEHLLEAHARYARKAKGKKCQFEECWLTLRHTQKFETALEVSKRPAKSIELNLPVGYDA